MAPNRTISPVKQTALDWIEANRPMLSDWHTTIWQFAEPAWREYRSAAWYVKTLRAQGFEVEEGSAEMPTAFCATYGKGRPVLGAYAEYDAVPANSQEPVPFEKPREGLNRWAAGHTDPHSALGIGSLAGALAAKEAMAAHGLPGTIKFFGEPAEKVCGSKPVHAAHGYYDGFDAFVTQHPGFSAAKMNTTVWETHCGSYWSRVYTFECMEPETWNRSSATTVENAHAMARAPGALDALCLMYTTTKYTKESMLPHTGFWTVNEAVLAAGQATADNLPPRIGQIQYSWRSPTLEMQEKILSVLENNAKHVAGLTHCRVTGRWVTKTRVGLANTALADLGYRNFEEIGPPTYGEAAKAFGRAIQKTLGIEPMEDPFIPEFGQLNDPHAVEALVRSVLPEWQRNFTSDDYVEYTWHAPTVRLQIGRPMLRAPQPGYRYPAWVWNALGGMPDCIDPMVVSAGRAVAGTLVDLLTRPEALAAAKAEFERRTGGGIGGARWVAPLLPKDFRAPVDLRWPEYVETVRGREWWIPTPRAD
jgi:aminobenzoyl-glutamate utilization protein B